MRRPQIIAFLILGLSLALTACAEGESVADAGPKSMDDGFGCLRAFCDAAPPPPIADFGAPDPEPEPEPPAPDVGLDMAPDMLDPNAPCTPGTRIGPCALCNLDAVPEMPEDDATCPTLTCGDAESYDRVIEGTEEICFVTRREPPGGRCRVLGECHSDPATYCGAEMREEVARITPTPCAGMQGCTGPTPPAVDESRIGAACNTYGICNIEGECTAPAECATADLFGNSRYCDSSANPLYCQFRVDFGRTSCNQFCSTFGMRCIAVWNDANNQCALAEVINCGDLFDSFICRCG
jgi:hypothetical protein